MAKAKLSRIKTQPAKDLQDNFSFIDDETLRNNLSITTQYLLFLISMDSEYELPGPVVYSVYKNIIVYLASLTEALISHTLKKLIDNKIVKNENIFDFEWKREICKDIITLEDGRVVKGVVDRKVYSSLSTDTQFMELNKAAKRAALFNDGLFNNAEDIRKRRNRIHIAGLKDIDDNYQKSDVVDTANKFVNIFSRIRNVLKSSPISLTR